MIEHQWLAEIRAEADRIGLFAARSDNCPEAARAAMIAHFKAYTAMLESTIAGDPGGEASWIALAQAELAARRKLFGCIPPQSLGGLADLISYTLCFSIPAWSDSDPEDEPIQLLKIVDRCFKQSDVNAA